MMKVKLTIETTLGVREGYSRPEFKGIDRLWLIVLAVANFVDGLVLLLTATCFRTNFVDVVDGITTGLPYRREKRMLAKDSLPVAYASGWAAFMDGSPDFINPYFNVSVELEGAWDAGYVAAVRGHNAGRDTTHDLPEGFML